MSIVTLKKDRSHLHSSLIVGVIGQLQENYGRKKYYKVYFASADLTIELFTTDFEVLSSPEEEDEKKMKIRSAYDVEFLVGSRGGFKNLKYKYNKPRPGSKVISNREKGLKILEMLKEAKIPIKTIKEKPASPKKK